MGRKPIEINPNCGTRLRTWLKAIDLSQKELANRINYTSQFVGDVVNGRKRLNPDFAHLVENCPGIQSDLVVNEDWLLCESDCMLKKDLPGFKIRQIQTESATQSSAVKILLKPYGIEIEEPELGPEDDELRVFKYCADFSRYGYVIKKDGCPIGRIPLNQYHCLCESIGNLALQQLNFFLDMQKCKSENEKHGSERNGE